MNETLASVRLTNTPLVIAHRGDSSVALENSLDAIRRALSYPVDMIELDIRKSSDNVLYVMHDASTGRTAEENIIVEKSRSDEISEIKLTNGEPVPTLRDVFGLVAGKAGLNLEIKSSGAGLLVAEQLAKSGYPGYVLLSSFLQEEVAAARRQLPQVPASLIFDSFSSAMLPSYRAQGYSIISLRKTTVSEKLVRACRDAGVQVYVWTVDEEKEMEKFITWEADGIYSNKPGLLKTVCERRRSENGL